MQVLESHKDAINWVSSSEKRILVLRAPNCSLCEEYFLGDFTNWAQSKTSWEFGVLNEILFEGLENVGLAASARIIGMGAPIPIENLNKLVKD